MCWLLECTSRQISVALSKGQNVFEARNVAQVYLARDLTRAYAEYYALQSFQKRLKELDVTPSLRPVLQLAYLIYGLWSLDRHLPSFYQVIHAVCK